MKRYQILRFVAKYATLTIGGKFGENACTAQELAYRMAQKAAKTGKNYLGALEDDTQASGAQAVGSAPTGGETPPPESMTPDQRMTAARAEVKALFGKRRAKTMKELRNKLGEMEYDGLVAGLNPPVRVDGGTIGKLTEATVLKRGTLLGKAEDTGLLSLYGGTGTPDCILCDDTEIGADEDMTTVVYKAGCFDLEKLIVAEGYTITEADKDKLRERGIVFKSVSPAL